MITLSYWFIWTQDWIVIASVLSMAFVRNMTTYTYIHRKGYMITTNGDDVAVVCR